MRDLLDLLGGQSVTSWAFAFVMVSSNFLGAALLSRGRCDRIRAAEGREALATKPRRGEAKPSRPRGAAAPSAPSGAAIPA
ncbi:MAG TPA: hypothetical protein VMO26_23830 [Vicinamibacterales bacterium]|nr:hypothetical protein [Vicinamibacterales bacterium]